MKQKVKDGVFEEAPMEVVKKDKEYFGLQKLGVNVVQENSQFNNSIEKDLKENR